MALIRLEVRESSSKPQKHGQRRTNEPPSCISQSDGTLLYSWLPPSGYMTFVNSHYLRFVLPWNYAKCKYDTKNWQSKSLCISHQMHSKGHQQFQRLCWQPGRAAGAQHLWNHCTSHHTSKVYPAKWLVMAQPFVCFISWCCVEDIIQHFFFKYQKHAETFRTFRK